MSERSERTSEANDRAGILSDLLLTRAIARVSGKSAIYYIIYVISIEKVFIDIPCLRFQMVLVSVYVLKMLSLNSIFQDLFNDI